MNNLIARLTSRQGRKWLYTVALALIALAAAYGLIDAEKVPVWLSVIAAVFGIAAPAMALRHLSPDQANTEQPDSSIDIPEDVAHAELDIEGQS